jgi:hypothetical protein
MHTLVILAAGEVQEVATVIDVRALAMLGSVLVPVVVQVVTKRTASEGLRALLGVLGAAVVTTLAFVVDPGNTVVNWVTVVNVFIASLVTVVGSYLAVYKPFGIAGYIADKTGNFGVGSPPTVQFEEKGAEDAGEVDEESDVEPVEVVSAAPLHDDTENPLDHVGERVEDEGRPY